MTYNTIKDEKDIGHLMKTFGYFHDACLKELHYISGGFVGDELGMWPFNSKRTVSMIIQRQYAPNSVIELLFTGIHKLNLEPRGEDCDCIIYGASLKKINGLFYWSDWDGLEEADLVNESGTWISAEHVMWRALPDALGEEAAYRME